MMELLKTSKKVKFNIEEEIKEEDEEDNKEDECDEDNIGFNYHLDNKKEDNKCYEIKKPDIKIV